MHISTFFTLWTIIGLIGFAKFVHAHRETLHQMAQDEVEATPHDIQLAATMVFMGGPLIWMLLAIVLGRRLKEQATPKHTQQQAP
jgi:flagellar biogenesis protein FliO